MILCVNGVFVALELKRDSKAPASRLQLHNLDLIDEAAGHGWIVHPDNWPRYFEKIKTLSEGGTI